MTHLFQYEGNKLMELLFDKWMVNHRRSFGYHTDMMSVCTVKDKIWPDKAIRVEILSVYEITTHLGIPGVGKYI